MSVSKKGLLGTGAAFVALTSLVATTFGVMQTSNANSISNQQAPVLLAQGKKLQNLTVIFPSRSDSSDLQNKANAVAKFLSNELKIPVKAQIGDDTAAVEALRANRADVVF